MKANRLNYLRLFIRSTSLLLLVSVLPQVHAGEEHTPITTERCEACQSSATPKAIETLIPEICSATMILTGVAPSTRPESSMVIVQGMVEKNGLVKVGGAIPTVGTVKKVRERDAIVVDENGKERRFPMFCTPSKKDTAPAQTTSNQQGHLTAAPQAQVARPSTSEGAAPAPNPASKHASQDAPQDTPTGSKINISEIANTTVVRSRIDKEEFKQYSQNISYTGSQVKATQLLDDEGKPNGIQLSDLKNDSFYKKHLDLQNGDRILAVNEEVVSPAIMRNMIRLLNSGQSLQIQVQRGEQRIVIGASVPK